MIKKKITIVHTVIDNDYKEFFKKYFDPTFIEFTNDNNIRIGEIDLVLFTGGADVNPSLYGEAKGKFTNINSKRDQLENSMFYTFIDVPKIGICRGAQYLTVLSGGRLIQHVDNHSTTHNISILRDSIPNIYSNNKIITRKMTSTHHQMMYPFDMKKRDYDILGWSEFNLSDTYLNGENEEIDLPQNFLESEIIKYNNTNSLCIQGHPEYKTCPGETKDVIYKLIKKLLF